MGFHKNVEGLRTSWLFAIQIDTISSKGKRVYFYLCLRVSRKLFWGGFGFPIWWIVSKPETDVGGCLFRHLWNGWHFWHVWLFVRTVKIKLNIAKPLEVYKCLFKCCNYFVTKAMFLQLYLFAFFVFWSIWWSRGDVYVFLCHVSRITGSICKVQWNHCVF